MSPPTLKPCPFCGCADIRVTRHQGEGLGLHRGEDVYSLGCYQCGASTPNRYDRNLLIASWNDRAPLKPDPSHIDWHSTPPPQDGSTVYGMTWRPVRWLEYGPKSSQRRRDRVAGRWQTLSDYGTWFNCEAPHRWATVEAVTVASAKPDPAP